MTQVQLRSNNGQLFQEVLCGRRRQYPHGDHRCWRRSQNTVQTPLCSSRQHTSKSGNKVSFSGKLPSFTCNIKFSKQRVPFSSRKFNSRTSGRISLEVLYGYCENVSAIFVLSSSMVKETHRRWRRRIYSVQSISFRCDIEYFDSSRATSFKLRVKFVCSSTTQVRTATRTLPRIAWPNEAINVERQRGTASTV